LHVSYYYIIKIDYLRHTILGRHFGYLHNMDVFVFSNCYLRVSIRVLKYDNIILESFYIVLDAFIHYTPVSSVKLMVSWWDGRN